MAEQRVPGTRDRRRRGGAGLGPGTHGRDLRDLGPGRPPVGLGPHRGGHPRSELVSVARTGHFVPRDAPEVVAVGRAQRGGPGPGTASTTAGVRHARADGPGRDAAEWKTAGPWPSTSPSPPTSKRPACACGPSSTTTSAPPRSAWRRRPRAAPTGGPSSTGCGHGPVSSTCGCRTCPRNGAVWGWGPRRWRRCRPSRPRPGGRPTSSTATPPTRATCTPCCTGAPTTRRSATCGPCARAPSGRASP